MAGRRATLAPAAWAFSQARRPTASTWIGVGAVGEVEVVGLGGAEGEDGDLEGAASDGAVVGLAQIPGAHGVGPRGRSGVAVRRASPVRSRACDDPGPVEGWPHWTGRRRADASLRGDEPLFRQGRRPPGPDREHADLDGHARPRAAGRGRHRDGFRRDRQLHRLPGPARQRPGALQGRPPLPSPRRPGRGPGPGQPDDLEDRRRRHPLRRRQGRDELRPGEALERASWSV